MRNRKPAANTLPQQSLLNWVGDVKNELNSNEPARDVTTAESLLKSHHDLGVDIRAHQDEFDELNQLGEKLIKRNPDFAEVKEKVSCLKPITILPRFIITKRMKERPVTLICLNLILPHHPDRWLSLGRSSEPSTVAGRRRVTG